MLLLVPLVLLAVLVAVLRVVLLLGLPLAKLLLLVLMLLWVARVLKAYCLLVLLHLRLQDGMVSE